MIIACKLAHFEKYPVLDTTRSSTMDCPPPLITYPEMDLPVEVEDRRANSQKQGVRRLRITGKADWALGYGDRKELGAGIVLIVVEAKSPATFSQGQNQLLTYLAIVKKLRFQENKTNEHV